MSLATYPIQLIPGDEGVGVSASGMVDAGAGVTDVAPVGEQAEKMISPSVSMEDTFS
jgi:hypothetical protein